MPKIHDLKTWPDPYAAVVAGRKTCEFRRDDRDYREGDVLVLQEYDPGRGTYTGEMASFIVTDLRRGGPFGIPEGYVMMSLRPWGEGGPCPDA